MPDFGDETLSRRYFEVKNVPILATRINLVTFFGRKTSYFGDETYSRHHFASEKRTILTTRPVLVTVLSKKCPILATRINLVTILR
ncbi:hypothetical protein [Caldifermentibacillus hisashii]|uniref:hypothetical protein n=1 Tax=Caldifermentibacillus hisashii TaxID=996558 RepID=UPI0011401F43|nr:hypothetical protein [Caldifermentibacillus hisashii]